MSSSRLLTGFSSKAITTRGDLIGWGSSTIPCSGINDPLMVSSLVLESNESRFALIALDLLAVDFAEADAIRARIAVTGVPPENTLIAASHTHCGPASIDLCSIEKNQELAKEIVGKAEQCVREASKSLAPASIRTAFTEFSDSVNRRQRNWLGRTILGVNPKGPVDHQLSCVVLETAHAKTLLLCYGCHPVISGPTSLESADYVAGIRRGTVSAGFKGLLFLNGALGDLNPYDRQTHRSLVGAGIDRALDFGERITRNALDALSHGEDDPIPQVASASATLDVSFPGSQGRELNRRLLVQALRIGRFLSITFPGEIFAQTSLDLRKKVGIKNLAIVSCANGYIGYVPPKADYARRGYEIEEVPRLLGYRVPAGMAEDLQSIGAELIASRLQRQLTVTSDSERSL